MPDFTHARICIRHASGSVEIQAPAGEVTWLDLSGLHALPIPADKEGRRKRPLLKAFLVFGFSAAVVAGTAFLSKNQIFLTTSRAETSTLEQPALLPDFTTHNAVQVPRAVPTPTREPTPQPAARDADPFGLRLK